MPRRPVGTAHWRAWWTVSTTALLFGCSPPPDGFEIVARLGPERVSATIEMETRPSLGNFPGTTILLQKKVAVPESRSLDLEIRVPPHLRSEPQLLVAPLFRTDHWIPLGGSLVPVAEDGTVRVEIDVMGDLDVLHLWIKAFAPPHQPETVHETESIPIPEDAVMDFGMGIFEPARDQGPVEFVVEACEQNACAPISTRTLKPKQAVGWVDERVSLADLAGRDVSFRFLTRSLAENRRSLPLWSAPIVLRPVRLDPEAPNLILVSLDTLRADHLNSYGYARDTAPFIESAFARRGTRFETAVSAIPLTSPSHMTMFTSLLPSVQSEVTERGLGRTLSEAVPTLAEVLRDEGFATGAVTENGALIRTRGFDRGFDSYRENQKSKTAGRRKPMDHTTAEALDWLAAHADRRFFLFLHTYQPHSPYLPGPSYRTMFEGDGVQPSTFPPRWDPTQYDREIRGADDRVRGFFEELETLGALDNTLVVITSDHGEAFLEHDFLAHGGDLHEEVLRVPLIFRGPGIPEGHTVATPVGLVDLMPTLLELMGAPIPTQIMGQSLVPLFSTDAPDPSWQSRPLFSETWSPKVLRVGGPEKLTPPFFSVRVGDRKLIRKRLEGEFHYYYYDLATDPGEQHNRMEDHAEEAADLRVLVDSYESMTGALRDQRRAGSEGEPDLDPETLRMLRELGYIE